jgi:hypothetical protein
MAFLIPVGIVGYKIWEHRKREEAKKTQALTSGDPDTMLQDVSSGEDSPSCSSESSTDTTFENGRSSKPDTNDADEKEGGQSPLKDILRFLAFEKSHENDPFRIRTNKEALTYEVMGNQGEKALPFPKISYR